MSTRLKPCAPPREPSGAARRWPVPSARVSRFSAWSLLAVFGIGVFLAGLELMITATALPSILLDLAVTDQLGEPAFSELRHASWIVNGYLLAYVVAMPLAGRLADVWGARRLFLAALVVFIVGLAGRRPRPEPRRADRRAGSSRGSAAAILVPVGTAAASHLFEGHDRPRALGIIGGADVPRDGRRPVPRRRDPRRARRRGRPRSPRDRDPEPRSATPSPRPGAGCSTSTSRSGSSPCSSRGPRRTAGRRPAAEPALTCWARSSGASPSRRRLGATTLIGVGGPRRP